MSRIAALLLASLLAGPGSVRAEAPQAGAPDAAQIIDELLTRRLDSGWRIRANVVTRDENGGERTVHLMAKGRRDADVSRMLVVGMWPKQWRGAALMVERDANGAISGFRFTPPDRVEPLDATDLDAPLFGTPLSAEALRASFWHWPRQEVTGRDRALMRDCWVLESQPAADTRARVRSCVAVDEHVPLFIERFDATGNLVARVEVEDLARRADGRWVPTAFTITTPASASAARTHVRFSRGDTGMDYPPEDFTVDAVKALIGQD